MTDFLYVCVGTRQRFDSWSHDNLRMSGRVAERFGKAEHIGSWADLPKLYGRHGPMMYVDLGCAIPVLREEVAHVVFENNYIELLRMEAQ